MVSEVHIWDTTRTKTTTSLGVTVRILDKVYVDNTPIRIVRTGWWRDAAVTGFALLRGYVLRL